jgi:hypothetical protein
MERHGGTAAVRSQPGEGTEVELTVPVTAVTEHGHAAPDGAVDPNRVDSHAAAGTVKAHADAKGTS